jgi:hypothetical protein
MHYMCLIYDDEDVWNGLPEDERNALYGEYTSFTESIREGGQYVQARDGKTLVTDGPFAETKEQLGGYYVIDAADMDEALKIAERIPSARYGSIEVRPVVVWED